MKVLVPFCCGLGGLSLAACHDALPATSVAPTVAPPAKAIELAKVLVPPVTLAPPEPASLLRAAFADAKNIRMAHLWNKKWVVGFAGPGGPAGIDEILVAPRDAAVVANATEKSCRDLLYQGEPISAAQVDLDGDGLDDLVVWIQVPASEETPAHVELNTVRGGGELHCNLAGGSTRLAQLLKATRTREDVIARLPALSGYLPPEAAGSTESLVLNIDRANLGQLRALVASSGLSICGSAEGNAHPHHHTCKRYAGAALTDNVLKKMVKATGYFIDWDDQETPPGLDDSSVLLNDVICSPTKGKSRTRCIANFSGPAYAAWVFEGEGAARRLVEVDWVAYEDS